LRVALSPAARRDQREAKAWYRRRSPQSAADFAAEIRYALRFIGEYPYGGPEFHGETRAKTLRRFPYTILYVVLPDRVRVVAIPDERRDPDFYTDRLS